MPLSRSLVAFLSVISCALNAANQIGFDRQPISWLLGQVHMAEARDKPQLIADSLERLLRVEPENLAGLCALARYQFAQQRRVEALATMYLIQSLDPGYPGLARLKSLKDITGKDKAKLLQARLMAKVGRGKQAIELYHQIFPAGMPTPGLKFEYIQLVARDGNNWNRAQQLYQNLVKTYPNTPRFDVAMAGNWLKKNPTHRASLAVLAKYATSMSTREPVKDIWLSALSDMPVNDQTLVRYNIFLSFYSTSTVGRQQRANVETQLARLKQLNANPYYQAWLTGKQQLAAENYPAAARLFNQALSGRAEDPEILGSLGLLYLRQGMHQSAIRYFNAAANYANEPDKRKIWLDLSDTAKFWQHITSAKQALASEAFAYAKQQLNAALRLNEDNQTVILYYARLNLAQGNNLSAQRQFKALVDDDPENIAALEGLLDIAIKTGDITNFNGFKHSLSHRQTQLLESELNRHSSALYRRLADQYAAQGEFSQAIALLQQAIKTNPASAWLYFDLAQIYQQQQQPDKANTVFDNALAQYPLDASLRYSHAVFLNSIDQYRLALASLAQVREGAVTESVAKLSSELTLRIQLQRIEQLVATSKTAPAIAQLETLGADPGLAAAMRSEISVLWFQLGKTAKAINQLEQALNQDPPLSADWHLRFGEWLLQSGQSAKKQQWFAATDRIPVSTAQDRINLDRQVVAYLIQQSAGKDPEHLLLQHLSENPDSIAALQYLVTLNLTANRLDRTKQYYAQLLALTEPEVLSGIELANTMLSNDEYLFGQTLIGQLIAKIPADEVYHQRLLMKALTHFDDGSLALAWSEQLIALNPEDPELLNLAGKVSQRFNANRQALQYFKSVLTTAAVPAEKHPGPDDTEPGSYLTVAQPDDPWYLSAARSSIAAIHKGSDGYIAVGVNFNGQTSTQTDSRLGLGLVPLEAYFPILGGQGFIKVDPLTIGAQSTDFTNEFQAIRYGQGLFCYPDCHWLSTRPLDRGFDLALGWQNVHWRFDIGSTPIGFLIEDIVWGVQYQNDWRQFSWEIALKKRPVTSSVLSYGGLEDVVSGQIWGGVRSTGLTLGLYYDLGLEWGFWSNLDYQQYRGANVKDNTRYRAMAGIYYRLLEQTDIELSIGSNLLHWAYQYNLSEETFGHGGYYSPQNYVGLSVPVILDGRVDQLVYRFRAGLSFSTTTTDTVAFFPGDPALQSLAEQRSGSAYFEGSVSKGISYSLGAALEYRITPRWSVGASFSIVRADFYEPNYAQLYIRYRFNPQYGSVPYAPKLIVPYSSF